MRNRAKCRLCLDIVESFHRHDYVECKCGEIAVDGGNAYFRCSAKDWNNFIRLEDDGTEITPKVIDKTDKSPMSEDHSSHIPTNPVEPDEMTTLEILEELQTMVQFVNRLSENVLYSSVTQADFYKSLMLICKLIQNLAASDLEMTATIQQCRAYIDSVQEEVPKHPAVSPVVLSLSEPRFEHLSHSVIPLP